jgi:hypothetical protein
MKPSTLVISTVLLFSAIFGFMQQPISADGKMLKGWLSDDQCARGRAKDGIYTSTNPECAKQCVAKGAKIVLILSDAKEVLSIENQDAVKDHVGDSVEVTGKIEPATNEGAAARTIHIETVTMVKKGAAMCGIPKKK